MTTNDYLFFILLILCWDAGRHLHFPAWVSWIGWLIAIVVVYRRLTER